MTQRKGAAMQRRRSQNTAAAPSRNNSVINADTFKRAEEAVSKLSEQYRDWALSDIETLRGCVENLSGDETRDDAVAKIRSIAHDMRGQGSTFGYPLITQIAQSISGALKLSLDPDDLIAQLTAHIDAVEAIIENEATGDGGDKGRDILQSLEDKIGRRVD
jgi:HPt (histidine-containing phosphotransfer) domain-containing protein